MSLNKLEWDEKYSVGVVEIDNQHKHMFKTINDLLELISTNSPEEKLDGVIDSLIKYKKFHFATEERYFKEFNFEGAADHIEQHSKFNTKLEELREKYPTNTIEFAFSLIDFLEDWLINHLLVTDKKYVECFHSHGLK